MSIRCVYVDDVVLVAEKPAGLLCVPGRGADKQDCLIHRLQREYVDALIVHRLDMATSGLLVIARNKSAQRELSRQFEQREVEKRYVAVVAGLVQQDSATINLPLIADWPNRPLQKVDEENGKPATTHYRVLRRDTQRDCSELELIPVTGRTHQLRVHMQAIAHPILGDALYGNNKRDFNAIDGSVAAEASRLLLHACYISFTHPANGERLEYHSAAGFLPVLR